jgi:hypothetical protein
MYGCVVRSWKCFRSQKADAAPVEAEPERVTKASSGWDVTEAGEEWGDSGDWGVKDIEPQPSAVLASVEFGVVAASRPSEDAVESVSIAVSKLAVHECGPMPALVPVGLEWYDEPVAPSDTLDKKAQALLDKFLLEGEPEEVEVFRKSIAGGPACSGGVSSCDVEAHERLSAAEKYALKFHDIIAKAPTQCIRFARILGGIVAFRTGDLDLS